MLYCTVSELSEQLTRACSRNLLSVVTGVCEHGSSLPNLNRFKDNYILASGLTPAQLSSKPLKETAVINFKLSRDGITNSLLRLVVLKQAPYLDNKECAYAKSKLNRLAAIEQGEKALLDYITNFKGSLLNSSELGGLIDTNREMVGNEKHAIADIDSRLLSLRDKINKYRCVFKTDSSTFPLRKVIFEERR